MARPTYQQLEEQLKVAQDQAGVAEEKARVAGQKVHAAELKRDAAERKRDAAEQKAATAQEHAKAAYRASQINDAVPYLPEATWRFMMKDSPDPATIFSKQVKTMGQQEAKLEGFGQFDEKLPFVEYHGWLGDIALLVELPKHGADLAIKRVIKCAAESHWRHQFKSALPNYDYVTLAAVCRKASIAGVANPYDPRCHMDAFVEPMQRLLPSVKALVLHEWSKNLQAIPSTIGRNEAAKEPPTKREAEAFLKKIWFPLTLKLLHELLQKEIAEYVVPLIAGNILPVEITDMICAFCYDGEFVARAPAIAKQNAPKITAPEDEGEDGESSHQGEVLEWTE